MDWAPIILYAPVAILAFSARAYDYYVLGIKPKRKSLDDLSPGEVSAGIGGGVILCAAGACGIAILTYFTPVSKIIRYLYFSCGSLTLVSIYLSAYLADRRHKSVLFGFLFFLISFFPCLAAFAIIYHNGAADNGSVQKIVVAMVSTESSQNSKGPHYEVTIKSTGSGPGFLKSSGYADLKQRIAENLKEGQSKEVLVKPGALGIPWIEKVVSK